MNVNYLWNLSLSRFLRLCPILACGLASDLAQTKLHAHQAAEHEGEQTTKLDTMVITGTRTAQRVRDVPVRTEVLTKAELAPVAPRTFADTLEYVTGVRIENDCQNCNFAQIRMLGLEGGYSQILVDGQPIVSALASVYAVEQLPATLIDRVEVVKGGGSALYGPGSIGGVVNLVPKSPVKSGLHIQLLAEDIDGTNVSSKSPNFSFSTSAQADLVVDKAQLALTVYAQGDRSLPMDVTGDGYSEMGFKELAAGGLRIEKLLPSLKGRVVADYNHSFENRRGGNNIDFYESEADVAESIQSTRDTGSLSWSQKTNHNFDYRLAASFANTKRDSYYGSGRDPNAFGNTKDPLYVLDSQFNHQFSSHLLSWGFQRNEEHLTDTQPSYSRQTDARYINNGLFLQDEWTLSEAWELLAGLRGDDNNQIENKVYSPRAALKWRPAQEWTVRASFASGFRAPQVFDEDLHVTQVGGTGAIIVNDPSLKEETAKTFNVEVEREFHALGAVWLIESNTFFTRIKDSFALEEDTAASTADETVFVRRNSGGAKIYGAEFNAGVNMGNRYRLSLGYVVQRSLFDELLSPLEGVFSRRIQRTPDHYGQMSFDSALPVDGLRLFVGLKYTGSMEVPHAAPDPADIPAGYPWSYATANSITNSKKFFVWDCSLSYQLPGKLLRGKASTMLRVGVRNLTNVYQEDLDQGEFRDSGYVYGPRQPRSVFIATELSF